MEENYKCPNCGASISLEEKKCSYCGSANKFYNLNKPNEKERQISEHGDKDTEEKQPNLDDIFDGFGGFLGGIALGKAFKEIKKGIFPHGKRD